MKLEITIGQSLENLLKIDINDTIEKALIQASLVVQNTAKDIAPFLSGNLKRSISVDYSGLKQLYTVVGSQLDYARRRHWENFKNPQTLRYLFRGYEENEDTISKIINDALKKSFNL